MQKVARGFSLVEMLIASTLLLMVMFLGTYAYSSFSAYWNKELGDFDEYFLETRGVSMLHSITVNLLPYMVKSSDSRWFHYFEGGNSRISAVTKESIANQDVPAVIELYVEEWETGKALYLKETAIEDKALYVEGELESKGKSHRLLVGFDVIEFEYFGWAHVDEYFQSIETPGRFQQQWFGFYSGKDTMVPPSIIKVTLVKNGLESVFKIPLKHFNPEVIAFYGGNGSE